MHNIRTIKAWLKDKNMTVVSRETTVPYSTLRLIRNGVTTNPDHDTIENISNYINDQIAEIQGGN
jgi:hypothetical protein